MKKITAGILVIPFVLSSCAWGGASDVTNSAATSTGTKMPAFNVS